MSISFNPYFTGSLTSIGEVGSLSIARISFNPYFTGSLTSIFSPGRFGWILEDGFNPYFTGSLTSI